MRWPRPARITRITPTPARQTSTPMTTYGMRMPGALVRNTIAPAASSSDMSTIRSISRSAMIVPSALLTGTSSFCLARYAR